MKPDPRQILFMRPVFIAPGNSDIGTEWAVHVDSDCITIRIYPYDPDDPIDTFSITDPKIVDCLHQLFAVTRNASRHFSRENQS